MKWRATAFVLSCLAILNVGSALGSYEIRIVPTDYPTLQAAVDASDNFDCILLAPGIYTGPGNRDVNIDGKILSISMLGVQGEVVLDLQGSATEPHYGLNIQGYGWATVFISNLTMRQGYSDDAGGAAVHGEEVELVISSCRFEDNVSLNSGGAVYNSDMGDVCCMDSVFFNNMALQGGCGGGLCSGFSTIEYCVFDSNSARYGGGASVRGASLVSNSAFINNSSETNAGGLNVYDSRSTIITASRFISNECASGGGGLFISDSDLLEIDACIFSDNRAVDNAGCDVWNVKQALIRNCLFSRNLASNCGGGMAFWGYFAAFSSNTFCRNVGGSYCSAMMLLGAYDASITNSIFWDNDSTDGMALSFTTTVPPVIPTNANINYCVLPEDSVFVSNPEECSITIGDDMIWDDPVFEDPDGADFQLSMESPCIDNGSNDNPTSSDLNGDDRWIGKSVDVGAYENQTEFSAGSHLSMDDTDLTEGDDFVLGVLAINTEKGNPVDLVVVLDVYGEYFFYPGWNRTFDFSILPMEYGRVYQSIFDMKWPRIDGSLSGLRFWSAILDPETQNLIGELDSTIWGYY